MRAILLSMFLIAFSTVTAAQECSTFKKSNEKIETGQYKEIATHLGTLKLAIPGRNQNVDVFIVLYTNAVTKSFTIVQVFPKDIRHPFAGLTCILVTGWDWHYNPAPEKEIGNGA